YQLEPPDAPLNAPHFTVYAQQELAALLERLGYGPETIARGGLRVYTTVDLALDERARQIAADQVATLAANQVSNAAVVVLKPITGEILAMVGSVDYDNEAIDGNVNVTTAMRQPGSTVKPFTYSAALELGMTPGDIIWDTPTNISGYQPVNYDGRFHGPVRMRTALANSYNIPAVKLLEMVGIPNVQAMAHRMGINGLNGQYGLALTLGGGEVTLLDLTYAYSVLAAQGRMLGAPTPDLRRRIGYRELDPVPILRVTDSAGNVLDDFSEPQERPVLTPQQAFLVTDVLSDNKAREPAFGPNSPLHMNRPAAAKTGTTNDWRDNWTVGYTPQLVTGVWVGNANGQPMREVSGVDGAAPIWHDFMQAALDGQPPLPFARPDGLEWVEVCALSGLRSTPLCPDRRGEWFIAGTAPTEPDNIYQKLRLCRATGRLAGPNCPPEAIEDKVYAVLPSEAADWARAADIPQPPPAEGEALVTGGGSVVLSSPLPQSFVRGVVPIMGMLAGPDLLRWRVQVGEGVNPEQWKILAEGGMPLSGRLALWDTRALNGVYTLRVAVERRGGVEDVLRLPVTVDTTPPTIDLVGIPAQINLERDEFINVIAEAEDNLSIDRVDFLLDGKPLGSATVSPYAIRWTPTDRQLGRHYIEAVAHDRAGNTTPAPRATIEVVKQR
ncbi:MAG: hypothetical protein KIS91_06970, partial [Anaerolineae bacterium]|nr:hypothetical protein [Anaerolineae bacterium]